MPDDSFDTTRDPLLDDLTEPQRQAVTHVQGPLLVLAGAGSGKTRVITRRIAHLVLRVGIPPWNVLAITFTNKAAGEMRQRVAQLVSERQARAITVCTFHSLCVRILRMYAAKLKLPVNFSIYDTGDQERAVKQAIEELGLNANNFTPGKILAAISGAKNELIGPDEFARQAGDFNSKNIARIYRKYQDILQRSNALDFDDLLVRTVALLRQHPDALAQLRDRYQYILIDEYQDTNHAQFVIANALASGDPAQQNICATGDPDQSIYGWRGANIRNILEFEQHYPRTAVVRLEQNYRSTKNILAVADALIQNNVQRKHKRLWTENEAGAPVRVVACADERAEAQYVVRQLRHYHETEGLALSDMAVFYRINSLSRVVEDALRNAGLPYQIARGTAFYERKEIKDAVAYLRSISNPADEINLLRIVNTPARGISDATSKALHAAAVAQQRSVFDMLHIPERVPGLNTRALNAVRTFCTHMEKWRFVAGLSAPATTTPTSDFAGSDLHEPSLRQFVETILHESGLYAFYKKDKSDPDQERLANLGELVSSAQQFETDYEKQNLEDPAALTLARKLAAFLEQIALVSDQDAIKSGQGSVTLMTLHAAKGLEFPVVMLVGFEDGLLPHDRANTDPDELEEERRLCFVGITRAMRFLTITRAQVRTVFGRTLPAIHSRFLRELPTPHIQTEDLSQMFEPEPSSAATSDGGVERTYESDAEFAPGMLVRHKIFGLGRVIRATGAGPSARVIIRFNAYGPKTLVPENAHLERVDFSD